MAGSAFFVINGFCLLVTAFCFIRICRHFDVPAVTASAIFLASAVLNATILEQFVIPWTTTPTCALIHIVLTLFLEQSRNRGSRRSLALIAMGLAGSLILPFRPTDVVAVFPVFAFMALGPALDILRAGPSSSAKASFAPLALTIAGGIAGCISFAALYYTIYGFSVSDYLRISQDIGFTFSSLPIKLYVLFLDPEPIYGQGIAVLERYPWLFPSAVGLLIHLIRLSRKSVVAACVITHILFYSCYADLLPTNVWDYKLIHYWKWTFPMLGLFAWLAIHDTLDDRAFVPASLSAIALFCLLSIRVDFERVHSTEAAIQPSGDFRVGFDAGNRVTAIDIPFGGSAVSGLGNWPLTLRADGRELRRYADYLALPQSFGLRLLLTHAIDVTTIEGLLNSSNRSPAASPPPIGRRFSLGFGWPCLLPPHGCQHPDARDDFGAPVGDEIDFRKGGNSTLFVGQGWSAQEDWGTWTDGDAASLRLSLAAPANPGHSHARLRLDVSAFGAGTHPSQTAKVMVNGETVGEFTVDAAGGWRSISLEIPMGLIARRHPVKISFALPDAISPFELGVSSDKRKLGLGLRALSLTAGEANP
ncbi:hypothetical protein N825_31850 [Skermanella stibiiresistens SB22]|uniref:Uncharacterized protein n=2 Tax=Skermanella TaxID=204447 RepID=W9GX03_9PROT|nr:hypothetical protein N825_31850 [Skermanella stibiiresistens SB22]